MDPNPYQSPTEGQAEPPSDSRSFTWAHAVVGGLGLVALTLLALIVIAASFAR